jgi:hypothetical protein
MKPFARITLIERSERPTVIWSSSMSREDRESVAQPEKPRMPPNTHSGRDRIE